MPLPSSSMKISTLIALLQAALADRGNIAVRLLVDDPRYPIGVTYVPVEAVTQVEWKRVERIEDLKEGNVVRHRCSESGEGMIVTFVTLHSGDRGRATAVRTSDLTNADEWLVLRKE